MKRLVMSDRYPEFCAELIDRGFEIIPTDTVNVFNLPEQKHADMQLLPINNRLFVLRECSELSAKLPDNRVILCTREAKEKYPANVLLNFLLFNNKLYGKSDAIDNSVKEYCGKKNINIININQGYARCSTLVINEKAAITADKSIEKALKKDGAEVLLIQPGHIRLEGFDYGFIGGSSVKIENTIYFFGNLENHPDGQKIKDFIRRYNSNLEILCPRLPLTDIGGAVQI